RIRDNIENIAVRHDVILVIRKKITESEDWKEKWVAFNNKTRNICSIPGLYVNLHTIGDAIGKIRGIAGDRICVSPKSVTINDTAMKLIDSSRWFLPEKAFTFVVPEDHVFIPLPSSSESTQHRSRIPSIYILKSFGLLCILHMKIQY
ncbi:MAG: hypothetical protein ABIC57_02215, partial [bacterium]